MKSADTDIASGALSSHPPLTAGWDAAAVSRAQQGDRAAFDELVLGYQDRIYGLIHRMIGDADEAYDLAQDTFVKAFQALSSFRRDARFSTWIYRIAVNLCFSRHRRQGVRKKYEAVSLDSVFAGGEGDGKLDPPDLSLEPARNTTRRETILLVRKAIAGLDIGHRTVILLRDMEGYSYEEIQEILGCPIGTVRSRLHRARGELARQLRREMGPE